MPTFHLHVLKGGCHAVAKSIEILDHNRLCPACITLCSDLLLKPPKELVLLAIDCLSALYFTATLFVGLKERKKGAVVASAVGVIIAIASFFI